MIPAIGLFCRWVKWWPMYSPAVGAFSTDIFQLLIHGSCFKGLGRQAKANQYTFIVTTRPSNKAGQLKPSTNLGASNKTNTVIATLTPSQTKNPVAAAMGLAVVSREVNPRANKAAGTKTAADPYKTDAATIQRPLHQPASAAKTMPTPDCQNTTCQTDTTGFRWRHWAACSAVSGKKSSSGLSGVSTLRCSLACILVVFLDIQVTPDEFRKAPHSRPKVSAHDTDVDLKGIIQP